MAKPKRSKKPEGTNKENRWDHSRVKREKTHPSLSDPRNNPYKLFGEKLLPNESSQEESKIFEITHLKNDQCVILESDEEANLEFTRLKSIIDHSVKKDEEGDLTKSNKWKTQNQSSAKKETEKVEIKRKSVFPRPV